jgi:hypothetical protein
MLAVLAAFFCLLFFAAAKKSRCRPAQGRRLKHEGKTRMPAQIANTTATRERHRNDKSTERRCVKPDNESRMPEQNHKNHPASQTKTKTQNHASHTDK